jgi:hypothetical protein
MGSSLARAGALLLAAACAGCSWHRAGEANVVAAAPTGHPMPSEGLGIAEVIALAETTEQGDFSADAEVFRVAKIADKIWEDVSVRDARRGGVTLDPAAEYVVVARRECSDWTSDRDRWSDERASWFLFAGGKLAAWDHFAFGAHCGLAESFRPVSAGSPSLVTERDLLRWLEQRQPPGKLPIELRYARGRAFAAAGRIAEARAMLRFGDDAVDAKEQLFEVRETTEEERAAFDAEARRLGDLRAELTAEIRAAEAREAAARAAAE